MHVLKFLKKLFLREDIETMVVTLPYWLIQIDFFNITSLNLFENSLDMDGASLFPLLHKKAELSLLREPDESMYMIRHNNKTKAVPILF